MSEYKEVAGEIIKRGEIYWFRYGGGAEGSEQSGTRPCVVVSNEKANQFGPIVSIVPLTTADKKKPLPTHVDIDSALVPSVALCEQVKSITKDRLSQYIGECTHEEMKAIDKGLRIQLALEFEPSPAVVEPKKVNPSIKQEDACAGANVLEEKRLQEMSLQLAREQERANIFERLYKELLETRIA